MQSYNDNNNYTYVLYLVIYMLDEICYNYFVKHIQSHCQIIAAVATRIKRKVLEGKVLEDFHQLMRKQGKEWQKKAENRLIKTIRTLLFSFFIIVEIKYVCNTNQLLLTIYYYKLNLIRIKMLSAKHYFSNIILYFIN